MLKLCECRPTSEVGRSVDQIHFFSKFHSLYQMLHVKVDLESLETRM